MQAHTTTTNIYISMGFISIMAEIEHTHKDGTKHKHEGGDKPHTHEKKTSSCSCSEDIGRNIRCPSHGDPNKL